MGLFVKDWSNGGPVLKGLWDKMHNAPLGKQMFTKFIGLIAPYSGTIPATVTHLEAGHAEIILREKRVSKNHLNSLHAMALTNVAELASGLSMMVALDQTKRGILKSFQIEFIKKGRGDVTAKSKWNLQLSNEAKTYEVPVEITNSKNEVVARAIATWLISPKDAPKESTVKTKEPKKVSKK